MRSSAEKSCTSPRGTGSVGAMYVSPTKPMSHQTEALSRLPKRPRKPSSADVMAWLMDKGTGKTKVILDEWQERVGVMDADYLDTLVVVAPKGSYRNWFEDKSHIQRAEINVHLDPRLRGQLRWAAWTGGAVSKRRRKLLLNATGQPRAFFINVEAFSGSSKKRGKGKAELYVEELLRSTKNALLVVDESTKMRGGSNRSDALLRLAPLAKARRILSGLVTPRSPLDLFRQFKFLDWRILGIESDIEFRNRYAEIERQCFLPNSVLRAKLKPRYRGIDRSDVDRMNRPMLLEEIERLKIYVQMVPIVKSYKNLDELHAKIAPYSYRKTKDECLDLEPKIYMTRDVEMTDEQARVYEEIKKTSTAELACGSHVVARAVISKMLRQQQILCGHVGDEDGVVRRVKSNRINELLEVLDDHAGKAIVWSTWRPEIADIVAAIRKEYDDEEVVAQFHGGNAGTRAAEERRFLSDPRCRFMVSSQATGGFGNTWTVADLVVYSSNNHDLELRDQSEDRAHRKGQTKRVTYVDLMVPDTVDVKIIQCLRNKMDLAAQINGDNYREWLI